MKVKDLKVGMILTLRNQSRYLFKCSDEVLVIDKKPIDGYYVSAFSIYGYDDNFNHKGYTVNDYDIVKIEYGDKVVWERKEN